MAKVNLALAETSALPPKADIQVSGQGGPPYSDGIDFQASSKPSFSRKTG